MSLKRAGLENKHSRLYDLRHARATHLAKYLTEAQMWTFFGWVPGTNVIRRYVHLSGRDVDASLLAISEGRQVQREEYKLKSLICIRCKDKMSPDSTFCSKCGLSIDLSKEYLEEKKMEEKIEQLEKQMNKQYAQIMKLIQQNPLLAQIKPEKLLERVNN